MNTPICDFVRTYSEKHPIRLHMPGHKGKSVCGAENGIENTDITEIDGADVLYSAHGIIEESQNNAAALFGSGKTLYSCEGSSLSIRAMLYLALLANKNNENTKYIRTLILAARNAHRVFLSAAALLDFDIEWLFSSDNESIISCTITEQQLEKKLLSLSALGRRPAALYITSPDYLGNITDIASLSKVCQRYGVLLLVDNAHGAYLRFLPENLHPLSLGADMCCDSAHKTLPVLTGGAYLHISKSAPRVLYDNAMRAMSLFASTSPSYLILQSLDRANLYLSEGYREKLALYSERISVLKAKLSEKGLALCGNETLKLTLAPKSYGYTGDELAEFLLKKNIVCEFSDPDYIVFMFTPETDITEIDFLEKLLDSLDRKAAIDEKPPKITVPETVMTVRNAVFSGSHVLPVSQCIGKILASENVSCPPAIPILVCGERIDKSAAKAFEYYGINELRVVTE